MPQLVEPEKKQKDAAKRVSISKILVTTDFSPVSDHALDFAIALARRYDARIYLAHIITPDPFQFAEPQLAQATYEKVRQAAEEGVTDILISGKLRGVPHEVLLEEGNVWPTLESLIRKHEIDLVLTGTHGRGKMEKLLIGSTAEEIFRKADCAVLTVAACASAGLKRAAVVALICSLFLSTRYLINTPPRGRNLAPTFKLQTAWALPLRN
jgi:nucleotide-binding universal stress UspA family protein